MQDLSDGCWVLIFVAVIIAVVLGVGGCTVATYTSITYVNGTIVSTPVQGGETYFVVKMDDGREEIFKNDDDLLVGKTNSGDYLIALQIGQHYQLKVNWFRFQLFSMYRNIIGFKSMPPPAQK